MGDTWAGGLALGYWGMAMAGGAGLAVLAWLLRKDKLL